MANVPYEEQLRCVLAATPTSEFIKAMSVYTDPNEMVEYVRRRYQTLRWIKIAPAPELSESKTRSGKVFRTQSMTS